MEQDIRQARRVAQRMLTRAKALGLVDKQGNPLVLDLMEELLAAGQGYRNAHAYRAKLSTRETPSLVQECPDESGSDYKLVSGIGCWLTIGAFSVHPYKTDEGIVVDVYAKGAEDVSIASTYAFDTEGDSAYCDFVGIDMDDAEEWAAQQGCSGFDSLDAETRRDWLKRFYEKGNKPTAN